MTLRNFFNHGHVGYMLMDAAVYDGNGTVVAFRDKGMEIGAMGILIGCSGQSGLDLFMERWLPENFTDIDDVALNAELVFERWSDFLVRELSQYGRPAFTVLVAGWSESEERVIALTISMNHNGGISIGADLGWSLHPTADERIQGRLEEIVKAGLVNPHTSGVSIANIQRNRMVESRQGFPAGHYVGGWLTLYTIDREGVRQEVIHRWNDNVGEKIDPTRDQGVPRNRQQRRKAERHKPKRKVA